MHVNIEGDGPHATALTGTTVGVDVSGSEKVWRAFQAIGDIAFAYAFSTVLVEIQASPISKIFIYLWIIINSYSCLIFLHTVQIIYVIYMHRERFSGREIVK